MNMDNDNVKMGGGNGIGADAGLKGASLTMQAVPPARAEMPTMDAAVETVARRAAAVLTEDEKLRAENLALKFENISFRKSSLQQAVIELNAIEQQAKIDLKAFKEVLAQKYGMDPTKLRIQPDGTLLASASELGQRP
jgi:hypothetical protein